MCVCVFVCVQRGQWMVVRQSRRLREGESVSFHVELQTFRKKPRALFCRRYSPPRFSQSQRESQAMTRSNQEEELSNRKCIKFPPSLLIPAADWKVQARRQLPSACWVETVKRGPCVSEGWEDMAERRDYTVSQTVGVRHTHPAARLTQINKATTQQFPLSRRVITVNQGPWAVSRAH